MIDQTGLDPASMFHGSLTLLMRSIRDDALRQEGHALRLVAAIVLLVMLILTQTQTHSESAPGLDFFEDVAYLGMMLITLAAIGHFSSSITEEKEQGTLGLLLLANMTSLSILLGKSTNRIFSAWLLLLALLPFSLLSLTLGGITTLQIVAAFVSLSAYLFFIANLALLVSVLVGRTNIAISVMLLLVLAIFGLPEAMLEMNRNLLQDRVVVQDGAWDQGVQKLHALHKQYSVTYELSRIFDIELKPVILSSQVVGSMLLGGVLFLLAWWRFSFVVWAPDPTESVNENGINQANRWIKLVARPWRAALAWKDFHFISGGMTIAIAKFAVYPLIVFAAMAFHAEIKSLFGLPALRLLQFFFLILLVAEQFVSASLLFQTERRNGTLSTIVMLPKSLWQISLQKVIGCLLGSVPTVMVLVALFWKNTGEVWEGFSRTEMHGTEILLVWTIGACILLVICQLTVLCSLFVNWGALPLALGIMMILLTVFGPILSSVGYFLKESNQPVYTNFGPVLYVTGMTSLALQFEITRRLRLLAGE